MVLMEVEKFMEVEIRGFGFDGRLCVRCLVTYNNGLSKRGGTTLEDYILVVLLKYRVTSRVKTQGLAFIGLYVAITLMKTLFLREL
jgi:hypothetical protein